MRISAGLAAMLVLAGQVAQAQDSRASPQYIRGGQQLEAANGAGTSCA